MIRAHMIRMIIIHPRLRNRNPPRRPLAAPPYLRPLNNVCTHSLALQSLFISARAPLLYRRYSPIAASLLRRLGGVNRAISLPALFPQVYVSLPRLARARELPRAYARYLIARQPRYRRAQGPVRLAPAVKSEIFVLKAVFAPARGKIAGVSGEYVQKEPSAYVLRRARLPLEVDKNVFIKIYLKVRFRNPLPEIPRYQTGEFPIKQIRRVFEIRPGRQV